MLSSEAVAYRPAGLSLAQRFSSRNRTWRYGVGSYSLRHRLSLCIPCRGKSPPHRQCFVPVLPRVAHYAELAFGSVSSIVRSAQRKDIVLRDSHWVRHQCLGSQSDMWCVPYLLVWSRVLSWRSYRLRPHSRIVANCDHAVVPSCR